MYALLAQVPGQAPREDHADDLGPSGPCMRFRGQPV